MKVNEVYGDKEELDYDDLNKLVYLEQCIKECLRTHPPAQMTSRVNPAGDVTVEGLFIPKGLSKLNFGVLMVRLEKAEIVNFEVYTLI